MKLPEEWSVTKRDKFCRWSRVFNNWGIGRGTDVRFLCGWIWCILLTILIHMIFSPMAQLKDSFFSGWSTFTFWTKLPLFSINLESFSQICRLTVVPFFQRTRTMIFRFHSLVWWHVSIDISLRTPVCKMSRILTNIYTMMMRDF